MARASEIKKFIIGNVDLPKRCIMDFTEKYGNKLRNIDVYRNVDLYMMVNIFTIICIGNRNNRRYETCIEIPFEMIVERRPKAYALLYEKMNEIAKQYLLDLEIEKRA